jgi:hypothetical protein
LLNGKVPTLPLTVLGQLPIAVGNTANYNAIPEKPFRATSKGKQISFFSKKELPLAQFAE